MKSESKVLNSVDSYVAYSRWRLAQLRQRDSNSFRPTVLLTVLLVLYIVICSFCNFAYHVPYTLPLRFLGLLMRGLTARHAIALLICGSAMIIFDFVLFIWRREHGQEV